MTAKGETHNTPSPHPLGWWTRDPLRLDEDGELMLGITADDGHTVTPRDYRVEQQVTALGALSGHRILQVSTTISAGPHASFLDSSVTASTPLEWKSLLVQVGAADLYVEIYRLQAGGRLYQKLTSAAIYGSGPNAILGTYDPDSGNGGGCDDGYWWFNDTGAHLVDFSPLTQAIRRATPPGSTYTPNCWAIHPGRAELQSWVQRFDASCRACGGLGEIYATYRIQNGSAIPVSVQFKPQQQE